jgi:hypothetical protein
VQKPHVELRKECDTTRLLNPSLLTGLILVKRYW